MGNSLAKIYKQILLLIFICFVSYLHFKDYINILIIICSLIFVYCQYELNKDLNMFMRCSIRTVRESIKIRFLTISTISIIQYFSLYFYLDIPKFIMDYIGGISIFILMINYIRNKDLI